MVRLFEECPYPVSRLHPAVHSSPPSALCVGATFSDPEAPIAQATMVAAAPLPGRALGTFHGIRRDCFGNRVNTVVDSIESLTASVEHPDLLPADNWADYVTGFKNVEDAELYVLTGELPAYFD